MKEIYNVEGLAELFIKEPSSLEVLFILKDEGQKTVEKVSNEIIYDARVSDLLDRLKWFDVIDIKYNLVNITDYGQHIVSKMRKKVDVSNNI